MNSRPSTRGSAQSRPSTGASSTLSRSEARQAQLDAEDSARERAQLAATAAIVVDRRHPPAGYDDIELPPKTFDLGSTFYLYARVCHTLHCVLAIDSSALPHRHSTSSSDDFSAIGRDKLISLGISPLWMDPLNARRREQTFRWEMESLQVRRLQVAPLRPLACVGVCP